MEDSVNQSLESQGNSSNIDALGQILIIVQIFKENFKLQGFGQIGIDMVIKRNQQ